MQDLLPLQWREQLMLLLLLSPLATLEVLMPLIAIPGRRKGGHAGARGRPKG